LRGSLPLDNIVNAGPDPWQVTGAAREGVKATVEAAAQADRGYYASFDR
jgi:hypothetical protein